METLRNRIRSERGRDFEVLPFCRSRVVGIGLRIATRTVDYTQDDSLLHTEETVGADEWRCVRPVKWLTGRSDTRLQFIVGWPREVFLCPSLDPRLSTSSPPCVDKTRRVRPPRPSTPRVCPRQGRGSGLVSRGPVSTVTPTGVVGKAGPGAKDPHRPICDSSTTTGTHHGGMGVERGRTCMDRGAVVCAGAVGTGRPPTHTEGGATTCARVERSPCTGVTPEPSCPSGRAGSGRVVDPSPAYSVPTRTGRDSGPEFGPSETTSGS